MFHHINGLVSDLAPNFAIIECGGVGFKIIVTSNTLSHLKLGEKRKLYICENIREDAFDLYGFIDERERYCYELLLGVSGVGPKAAISILSVTSPETFAMAIINDNEKALTAATGIGKKIAQRILLELKDKIAKATGNLIIDREPDYVGMDGSSKLTNAASALSVLGYSNTEIATSLNGIDVEKMELEDIVKVALKKMLK